MGRLSESLRAEIQSYDDAKWSGTIGVDEYVLFAKPLTTADMTRISRRHPDFTRNPQMDGMVDLLMMKATLPDGEKAFDMGDKPLLTRVETNKIGEIFSALFGGQLDDDTEEDQETRKGN